MPEFTTLKTPNLVCHLRWFYLYDLKELIKGIVRSQVRDSLAGCGSLDALQLSYLSQVSGGKFWL